MVADVELQLEVLPVHDLLVEAHRAVVEHLHRQFRRADEARDPGVDHLAVEQHGALLALGEMGGAGGVGLGARVDGEAARGAGLEQDPGALQGALDAVEVPLGLGLQVHAAFLRSARAGRVGGRAEVQGHPVLGQHPAEPGTPVEAHVDGDGFLDPDLQAPGAELFRHPVLGVVEHMGADDAAADVAGDVVRVFHRPVVGLAQFQDGFRDFVLRLQGERGEEDRQQQKCLVFHPFYVLLFTKIEKRSTFVKNANKKT